MTNSELISTLSDLMDDKLQPLKEDVQVLKTEAKGIKEDVQVLKTEVKGIKEDVEGLKENVEGLKEDVMLLREDVDTLSNTTQILKGDIQILNLKIENDVSPRLQTIEECYTSTFFRYRDGIVQLDQMQTDIDVLKSVVRDHSKKMQKNLIL